MSTPKEEYEKTRNANKWHSLVYCFLAVLLTLSASSDYPLDFEWIPKSLAAAAMLWCAMRLCPPRLENIEEPAPETPVETKHERNPTP